MKIVFGILLFTFVVFLRSTEVSSSGEGTGGNAGRRRLVNVIPFMEFRNQPAGHLNILPNGAFYVSTGTGDLRIDYNVAANTVTVHQAGSPTLVLGPGPRPASHYQSGPGVSVLHIDTNFRPPPPRK